MTPRRGTPVRGSGTRADASDDGGATARLRIEAGTVLEDRYRLDEELGRGSMGVVFRATDLRLDRPVALKVLAEASSDERRLHSEVRALARLSHPNLVRIYDAGEVGGDVYIVMELIDGTTLAARLQQGALSSEETARIGADIAGALSYVHHRGVIHRDVKPANILIGQDGSVRLADFGIARLVDSAGITATGTSIGTPAYLAPEQVRASGVGPEADVFALGLVLLECLTGQRAYRGTAAEVAASRLHARPEIPEQVGPPLREVISKMTELEPHSRLDADDVASSLAAPPATVSSPPVDAAAETVSDTRQFPKMTETAERVITPVVLSKSKRDRWRFAKTHKTPSVIAAAVLAAFGLGLGLGTTFTSGPSGAGAGVVAHDSKAKHPGAKTGSSTTTTPTTTPTTTTSTTTTTTTPPPTTEQAASHLDSTIENGVAKGTIPTPVAEQLTAIVQPLIAPTQSNGPPQTAQLFNQLVEQFDQSVTTGVVSDPSTIHQVDAALNRLATTLGVTMPASTGQPGPGQPTGQGDGNGHGHGNGNG